MTGEPEHAPDPGLAAERTQIAWGRNAVAVGACLAMIVRRVPSMSRGSAAGLGLVIVVSLATATLFLRSRLKAHIGEPAIDVTAARLRNLAALTSAVGAVCLVVMLAAL